MEDVRPVVERVPRPPAGRLARLTGNAWARSVAQTASTRLILLVVGLASTVVLARALGPTGRGLYAVAVTTGTLLVVVGNLGFHAVNTYYGASERSRIGALVANSGVLTALVTAVTAVAFGVANQLWPGVLPVEGALMLLVLGWVPIGLLFTQLQPLVLVVDRVRAYNAADALSQLGAVALIVLLWAVGMLTPSRAYGGNLLATAAAVTLIVWTLRHRWRGDWRPSWPLARRTFPYAVRSYLTSVTLLLLLRLDILLVQAYLGDREVGYYTVAATIGEVAQVLPATVGTLLFPRLSSQADAEERWRVLRRVSVVTAGLMVALSLAIALLARIGVRVIYGEAFLPSVPAIYWLVPGFFFLGMNSVLLNYFLAVRMPPAVIGCQAAAVVLNVLLNVVLLPRHGIVGASLASTIAYGALFLAVVTYALRTRGRRPARVGP